MGWYVNTDCTILMDFSSWVMQKDGTVFAKWHENPQFTLSFNLNGGTGDIESQLVYRGETPIEPSVVPTKDGYAFDGWYIDGNLTKPMVFEEWEMAYSGTVFAKWVEVTEYTVSFDANGGTGTYRDIKVIEGNKIVEPAAPTRVGYSFIGWETWSGNRVDISSYRVYSNLKLFAVWSEASYTLEFNLNGGSGVFPTQYYIYGQNPVEPSTIPTKTGYTFEGWYIDSKLTKPMVFEEWEMQHSGAVFAIWSQASFKVSFANTGSDYADLGIEDQFVTADGLITKPADPVREGFKFVGWFAYAGATQQVDFNTFKVSGDQMIYARWVNE